MIPYSFHRPSGTGWGPLLTKPKPEVGDGADGDPPVGYSFAPGAWGCATGCLGFGIDASGFGIGALGFGTGALGFGAGPSGCSDGFLWAGFWTAPDGRGTRGGEGGACTAPDGRGLFNGIGDLNPPDGAKGIPPAGCGLLTVPEGTGFCFCGRDPGDFGTGFFSTNPIIGIGKHFLKKSWSLFCLHVSLTMRWRRARLG